MLNVMVHVTSVNLYYKHIQGSAVLREIVQFPMNHFMQISLHAVELIYMDTDTLLLERQLIQLAKLDEKTVCGESATLQAEKRNPDPKQSNAGQSSSLSSLVSSGSSSSTSSSPSSSTSSQVKADGKTAIGKSRSEQVAVPRKPRLGQSSLNPINVLPATKSTGTRQAPAADNEYVCAGSRGQCSSEKKENLEANANSTASLEYKQVIKRSRLQ